MLAWPNWVDLIVLTIVLTTSYRGFHRGLFTGIIGLLGAIFITALVVNYSGSVMTVLEPWLRIDFVLSTFLIFWCCFGIALLLLHQVLKVLSRIATWERLNIITQLIGMVVGGLRGAWWSGVILMAFSGSGIPYLQKSVEDRSVTAPYIMPPMRAVLEQMVEALPGESRHGTLFPPLTTVAPS